MKLIKKINKGLVLTIIVLLVLIIYIVSVEIKRNAEKLNIEQACKEYIELINEYAKVPSKKQKLYNVNSIENTDEQEKINKELKSEIASQMNSLEQKLKTKMIDNQIAINMQKDMVESFVTNNNNSFASLITGFDKEITKIRKFEFDENQVTVTFNTNIEQEIKYIEENEELTKKDSFYMTDETITLQKVDGSWKVIYADLQYQDYSAEFGAMTVTYGK